MYIELEYFKYKNFLSYGAKETEHYILPGLTSINGRNGSGKSTFLDVISYNWFGKPYRKVKLEALINGQNKKGLETETKICINKKDKYRIIRNMKPNKLIILKNDEPLQLSSSKLFDQEDINKIIGIDYKMFRQIVSLAVIYNKPFLTQEAAEKREIVESIFNIKILGAMLDAEKKKISTEKVKYAVNKKNVEMLNESISIMTKNIDTVKESIKEFEKQKLCDVIIINNEINILNKNIENFKKYIKKNEIQLKKLTIDCSSLKKIITERQSGLASDSYISEIIKPLIEKFADEIKELDLQIKSKDDEIVFNESNPVDINEDAEYKKLLADRLLFVTEGMKLKDEYDNELKNPIDYTSDKEYNELLQNKKIINDELVNAETLLKEKCEEIDKDTKLSQLTKRRDELTSSKLKLEHEIELEQEYVEYLKNNKLCIRCKSEISESFRKEQILKSTNSINDKKEIINNIVQIDNTCKKQIDEIQSILKIISDKYHQLLIIENPIEIKKTVLNGLKKERMTALKNNLAQLRIKIQNQNALLVTKDKEINENYNKKISTLKKDKEQLVSNRALKQNSIDSVKKDKCHEIQIEISSLESQLAELKLNSQNEFKSYNQNYHFLQSAIENLGNKNKYKDEIESRQPTFNLTEIEKELESKIKEYDIAFADNITMADKLKIYDITASLLSEEGIKSYFFKKFTPILNSKINEYLIKFDIPIKCTFNEQMDETLSNVDNVNEPVSYFSYSAGEQKSIDTAILFSFLDLTKILCNWNCNILLIDELMDGQVDLIRLEKVFDCLLNFASSGMIPSIYIISHRLMDILQNYFKQIITIEKVNGYSQLTVKHM